jgi:riboflavin transporter FmnP
VFDFTGAFFLRSNINLEVVFMNKTRYLTVTAMFAVISAVLMFFEFPLPLLPTFLKLDLSDVPVLIGAFVLGPVAAISITLLKDLIHMLFATTSAGVGELADFMITSSFVIVAGLIYKLGKIKSKAVLGCIAGVIVMIFMGALSNYYLLLPFYSTVMPLKQIFAMCATINPLIVDTKTYILYAVMPFNLLKGALVSIVTLLVYKRLTVVVSKQLQKR